MPFTKFAWLVHCNNEASADPALRDVSVNWVMPWGGVAGQQWPDPGTVKDGTGADAWGKFGILLLPWRHTVRAWHGVRADGTLVLLDATEPSVATDRLGLQARLENELRGATDTCLRPFSIESAELPTVDESHPERMTDAQNKSIAHAFAPLTHLPVPVAQDTLGVTRYFRYPAAQGDFVAYAPTFTFGFGPARVEYSPDGAVVKGKIVHIDYTGAVDPPFQIITQFAAPAPPAGLADPRLAQVTLDGSEVADTPAREAVLARALAPIDLLVGALPALGIAAGAPPGRPLLAAAPARDLLADVLRQGLLRKETVVRPDGTREERCASVWERLPTASAASAAAICAHYAGTAARTAVLDTLEQMRNETRTTLAELWTAMAPLLTALAANAEEPAGSAWPLHSYGSQWGRALLETTARLLGSTSARQLRAMWFGALAVDYAHSNAAHPFFEGNTSFLDWYRRLLPVVDEQLCALLLVMEDDNQVAAAWLADAAAIGDASAVTMVDQLAARTFAWAGHTLPAEALLLAPLQQDALRRVDAVRIALKGYDHLHARPVSLGEDRDLAISVAFASPPPGAIVNQEIRGYAVAIAAGFGVPEARLNWQWITDVAARVWNGATWDPVLAAGGDKTLARMHDTIGATRVNGRDVVSFPYGGQPLNGRLNSIEGGGDPDGVACLDFFWPQEGAGAWPTPRLAYGLHYWVFATPLGNSGRVLEERHADPLDRSRRRLKTLAAGMFVTAGSPRCYVCRVTPGSPLISVRGEKEAMTASELANESRTRVYLGLAAPGTGDGARIALIRPDAPAWLHGATQLTFDLRGPDGTPNVIERWLDADIAARQTGYTDRVDRDARHLDASALAAQRDRYRALLKPLKTRDPAAGPPRGLPRHPAVRAFAVDVAFFDRDGHPVPPHGGANRVILTPRTVPEQGYIGAASILVRAHAVASRMGAPAGGAVTIDLLAGQFASVTVSSLVPADFFVRANPACRMDDFAGAGDCTDPATGIVYRRFAPAVHWVECLPQVATDDALLLKLEQRLAVEPDGRKVLARLTADPADPIDATWIKGFLVQRHEWHWSGYPIAFPRTSSGTAALRDWAEPFIGTESLRQSTICEVQSHLPGTGWTFAGAAAENLVATELPGEHGAKYVAFVVRPIRRFDRWLRRWTRLDNTVLAAGLLAPARVRWDDASLRLGPPDIRAAVPLVNTFELRGLPGQARVANGVNGCLLCLNDVLYRTDALSRFGGVGESLDVDLEETRCNEIYEISPNPVFHAAPGPLVPSNGKDPDPPMLPYPSRFAESGAPAGTGPYRRMDWQLEADRPFGLTHDLDRNAMVAQTAVIIRPRGNDVGQYWVMAKVRVRKVLDPDAHWTASAPVPRAEKSADTWLLGRRPEGDDWVPHDFCVDGGATARMLRIGLDDAAPPCQLDALGAALATRYLCTWHKGYWANNDEFRWGLQIHAQQLLEELGQWRTVARWSPHETHGALFNLGVKEQGPLAVKLEGTAPAGAATLAMRRLLVSDYTQPHWLTFIGRPYRAMSFADEAYWVVPDGKGLAIRRTNKVRGHDGVLVDGEPVSRDLMLLPVAAADFNEHDADSQVARETNSFHLLLMFRRINDVSAPAVGLPLGELINVYRPVRAAITAGDPYPPMRFVLFMADKTEQPLPEPANCVGYIYRFHCPHRPDMPVIKDWQHVQTLMFPHKDPVTGAGPEAKVRWTPELIGPIALAAAGAWPDGVVRAEQMQGKTVKIASLLPVGKPPRISEVEIVLDEATGWRVTRKRNADDLLPDDIHSGNCQQEFAGADASGLELQVAGGRPLARLMGWPAPGAPHTAPQSVQWYQRDGNPQGVACTWELLQ